MFNFKTALYLIAALAGSTALNAYSADKKPAPTAHATPAAPAVQLSAEQLAIAERVNTGRLPCELGTSVQITEDAKHKGHFTVAAGKTVYHMTPVPTTTGAIRLEDKKTGGVWLVLANKSMLLNEKLGKRVADGCQTPAQKAMDERLKAAPPPALIESK